MSLPDIQLANQAISFLGQTDVFDIIRFTGSYIDGKWLETDQLIEDVPGNVYNVSSDKYGRVIDQLPEGSKTNEWVLVWTKTEIRGLTDTQNNPDRVIWNGKEYQILHVWDRIEAGYYRGLASRYNEGSNIVE